MADEEKVFAKGFSFKRNDKAPDFVIGNISVKVDDAIEFLKEYKKNGWVNMNVKKSQGGAYYMDLDQYEPAPKVDGKVDKKVESEENEPPF
jgi:hypothetical protein